VATLLANLSQDADPKREADNADSIGFSDGSMAAETFLALFTESGSL
jgi:hypothetical protein